MNRRNFIIDISLLGILNPISRHFNDPVFGHGNKRYVIDKKWQNNQQYLLVKDCHEMVFDPNGNLILLTNETKNNFITFNKDGKIISGYGSAFPGGHGLSILDETLYVTDTDLNKVFITKFDATIIKTFNAPLDSGYYSDIKQFVPTETAITSNGELYIADGYGSQFITHFDTEGNVKNIFGGRGEEERHLDNAHGICIDTRGEVPSLIVTDRNKCCFKRFSMDGEFIETINIPGANVCRPVIKGDYLYSAVLTTDSTSNANSGFVIILDKNNKLVSAIGGATPIGNQRGYQTIKLFKHPHDVAVDDDENLYVCQWNSGKVYPMRFNPI